MKKIRYATSHWQKENVTYFINITTSAQMWARKCTEEIYTGLPGGGAFRVHSRCGYVGPRICERGRGRMRWELVQTGADLLQPHEVAKSTDAPCFQPRSTASGLSPKDKENISWSIIKILIGHT